MNPYTDRMDAIARLRMQKAAIEAQIGDEIAKAWRLAPVQNFAVFAQNLGLSEVEVQGILEARGIRAVNKSSTV